MQLWNEMQTLFPISSWYLKNALPYAMREFDTSITSSFWGRYRLQAKEECAIHAHVSYIPNTRQNKATIYYVNLK